MAGWWTYAKAGDQVECVHEFKRSERIRALNDGVTLPVLNTVYTIREVEPGAGFAPKGSVFFRFRELRNAPHVIDGIEPSFWAEHFRPVQKHNRSTETGMEKLRSFLKDAKQPVEEEA